MCGPFDASSFCPLLSGSQRNPSYFELGNPGRQGACLQRNSQNSSLDQHRVRGDVGAGTLPTSSSAGTRLKPAARMREKLHSCPPRLLAGAPPRLYPRGLFGLEILFTHLDGLRFQTFVLFHLRADAGRIQSSIRTARKRDQPTFGDARW